MTPGYQLVRTVIRLLLRLFYRRIDVVGRERIPATGPVLAVANHHNSIVDAMQVVTLFLTFLLAVILSGVLALAWRERLGDVGRQARAFVWFLTDRDLHRRLLQERRALVDEARALGDLVPPHAG